MHDRPNDRLEHSLPLCRNSAVPEAQDAKILRLQKFCALLIVVGTLYVLAAVQLDDQPASQTGEISDVLTDRNLSPKTSAWNPSTAKILP
jgi:hypothetical protein